MKKKVPFIGTLLGLLVAATALAAPYYGEWIQVSSLPTEIRSNVLRRPWTGNTPEQAADAALRECAQVVQQMQSQGLRVLAYRGNSIPTASPYIFYGNCDVQLMR